MTDAQEAAQGYGLDPYLLERLGQLTAIQREIGILGTIGLTEGRSATFAPRAPHKDFSPIR